MSTKSKKKVLAFKWEEGTTLKQLADALLIHAKDNPSMEVTSVELRGIWEKTGRELVIGLILKEHDK